MKMVSCGSIAVTTMALGIALFFLTQAHAVTITVTSSADDGAGTLRQAIITAAPGDTIDFDAVTFPPASSPSTTRPAPPPPSSSAAWS